MTPPPPDASVRLHLKCPDAEDFVERFAPNVTRGGIFLPTRDAREVGATIRFEIALLDDTVVFAGEGVVTWAKPKGMGVKFTTLDPATEPMLERLLSRREAAAAAPDSPAAVQARPASAPSLASGSATAWESLAAELARPTPPALPAWPTPAAAGATDSSPLSIEPRTRRPLVRVALVCSAVFVGVAVVWMSIGRARVRTGSPAEPAKPATVEIAARAVAAPALETATLPPPVPASPAHEPPTEAPPAPPAADARAHPCPGQRALRRASRREDARRRLLQELHLSQPHRPVLREVQQDRERLPAGGAQAGKDRPPHPRLGTKRRVRRQDARGAPGLEVDRPDSRSHEDQREPRRLVVRPRRLRPKRAARADDLRRRALSADRWGRGSAPAQYCREPGLRVQQSFRPGRARQGSVTHADATGLRLLMPLAESDDVACMSEPFRQETSRGARLERPSISAPPPLPSAEADELASDLLVVVEGPQGSAAAIITTCEAELTRASSPDRAARLHHEIARTQEVVLGDMAAALRHYEAALEQAPDHLASIRGARRVLLQLKRFADALPFWDAELRVVAEPKQRAALQYQKARFLSETLGDDAGARAAYAEALELDPANSTILKALERCHQSVQEHRALVQTYERAANAVADQRLRAAFMVRRAQILANDLGDEAAAAEIYLGALQIDNDATGAHQALEAIATSRQDWSVVIALLGQTAVRSQDAVDQALALYRTARVHAERLGNRREATAALEAALACTPGDSLILEELVRLHGEAGESEVMAAALRVLVDLTTQTPDRVALLHTLGRVYEGQLGRDEEAIHCYREALGLDATHTPLLQSLGKLLTGRQDWLGLVEMHLAEAAAGASSAQRAAAHARAAEILERRLRRPADAAFHHAQALALVPGFPASFKALVRLYGQSGQHRELVELYERAIDETTTVEWKVTYLFNAGALWEERLGDGTQAAHAYRRILDLQSDNLGALHALQRVLEKTEQYDKLVSCLEREAELTQEMDLVLGLLHRAGTILDEQIGDQTAAKQRFLKALDIDPSFVPALASLGRIHYRAGQWDDLLQMYRRELDASTDERARVALLVKMGELSERQMGKPKDAIANYREAFELAPAHRPALSALVRLLRQAGEYNELALLLEKHLAGLETPAGRALTAYRIGELYEEHLDSDVQAIEFYRKALAEVPGYRPAALALARVLERAREWTQVLDHLAREAEATTDQRRRTSILMRQGELWRDHMHDNERAITCFEALAAADPCSALLALEDLYARAGDWAALAGVYSRQAEAFVEPAAKLAALRELARVQEVNGVGAPAERARTHERILALAPDDTDALRGLAEAARRLGDDAVLGRAYARLAELEADATVAAEWLLRVAQMLEAGEHPDAMTAYRGVLRRMPENLSAVRGLARLAEANADTGAWVEALRREAALTTAPEEASALLVRSASVCSERGNKSGELVAGAVEDLERALELWPDSAPAAEALRQTVQSAGRAERLVDILSKAATTPATPSGRRRCGSLSPRSTSTARTPSGPRSLPSSGCSRPAPTTWRPIEPSRGSTAPMLSGPKPPRLSRRCCPSRSRRRSAPTFCWSWRSSGRIGWRAPRRHGPRCSRPSESPRSRGGAPPPREAAATRRRDGCGGSDRPRALRRNRRRGGARPDFGVAGGRGAQTRQRRRRRTGAHRGDRDRRRVGKQRPSSRGRPRAARAG